MFAQLSIKSKNQQTHDQCREHEDERSHQIPVDSLRVADSGHGAVTRAEQKHDREYGRNAERYSVADTVSVHPEHDPAHDNHDDTGYVEVNEVVTDTPAEGESYDHVAVFT